MKVGQRVSLRQPRAPKARAPKAAPQSTPPTPRSGAADYVLFLQRTAGNQAVGQLLRQYSQRSARTVPTGATHRQGNGSTAIMQRGLLDAMSTFNRRIIGTDQSIGQFVAQKHEAQLAKDGKPAPSFEGFQVVKNALAEEQRLKDQRDAEIQATGKSDINPDDALLAIPEEYRPRRITPSEKAVKANKQQFLDEAVLGQAEKQRKVDDIHAVRVMKAQLGLELKNLGKDSPLRYPVQAQLEALAAIGGPDDIAKLDPGAVEQKLQQATLKGKLKGLEKLDGKKGPKNPERATIEAELQQMKERKKQKKEIVEKLEAAQKSSKVSAEDRELLKQLIGWIKGKGVPENPIVVASTGVEVLGDQYRVPLLEMINMKGANDQNWTKKLKDSNAEKAGSALNALDTVTGLGSTTATGAKSIASLAGNKAVGGASHNSGGKKIITQVGTAQQGADVLSSAGNLLSLGSQITEFVSLAKAIDKGDPAEQKLAYRKITDGVFSVGHNLIDLGTSATKLAGDFGGAGLATELAGTALPIFDIVAGALSLIQHGKELTEAAVRVNEQGSRIKTATTEGAEHIALAIGQFKRQGAALITTTSFALAADGLKIVGGAITLSGIGAIVGYPIKLAGTALSLANKAGMSLYSSFQTGKAQEARASDMLALPGSSEKLMATDPKHASQALIREARGGSKVALEELASYGVSKRALDGSSDQAIRKLMLSQLKLKEDDKSVGESVKQGAQSAKDWLHVDSRYQVTVLAKIKNKLNYGGKGDRGAGWKAKILAFGDVETSTASLHKILEEMGPAERAKYGITEEEFKATRPQSVRDRDNGTPMVISGPIGVLPMTRPRG